MIVLILSLVLLIGGLILGQLNPQTLDFNFFGMIIKGVPMSLFMLVFVLIGVLLTALGFGMRHGYLLYKVRMERKQMESLYENEKVLKAEIKELKKRLEEDRGNS